MRSISVATRALRNNLELNGVLRTAFVQVSQLMNTENFTVALHNDVEMITTYPLVIRNGQEVEIAANSEPDDYGLIKHIMAAGTPLLIKDDVVAVAKQSIVSRDYPMVQASVLILATAFVLVNLLVDLTYRMLNPRIRLP
jgi:hypothetical protein